MKTLFIYDDNGKIYTQITGFFKEPVGLNYLIEEIPQNSYPIKVNVENESHFVEYGYHPKSEVEQLQEIVEEQNMAIFEMAEMMWSILNKVESEAETETKLELKEESEVEIESEVQSEKGDDI